MKLEKYLNTQQIKAVRSTEKPLLVIAGAGSGKTRVLTYRIAYLINNKGVDPFNILAITFTNKAAKEMKRRVIELVGRVGEYMWVSTFHSFCARMLRYEIDRLGISRSYVIYDADDSLKLISRVVKEMDMDIKRFPPRMIASVISDAKNRLIDYETYSDNAADYLEKIAAKVYTRYQERLIKADALDFDDLLMYTVNILDMYPEVKEKYQEKFKYILVDEFQDTNIAQNEIVVLLSEKSKKLCVVGDDDQNIYSWRGAEIKNITDFDKRFNDTVVIKLEQNYRSTQNILNASNCIIKNNENRKNKKLWTENPEGEIVSKYIASDEKGEVRFIVKKIREYMKKKDMKYRDFAVFYRTNAQSRAVEEYLVRQNIPYKIYGGLRFYDRKEIKDMLAYMKLIVNPKDVVSLTRIVNVPRRKIGKTTISVIEKYSRKNNMTFCEAFYRADEINALSKTTKKRVADFVSMMSELRDFSMKNGAGRVLEEIWKRTGYMKKLKNENTIEALNRIDNLKELLTVTREYEDKSESGNAAAGPGESDLAEGKEKETGNGEGLYDLGRFLEEVSLLTDIDNYDENTDGLVLMTLHNAKGLEFPVVFIIGMEEGIFPHSRCMNNMEELEEERRLCYVGITRAKKKVFLSSSRSHSIYGDTSFRTVSRFINEIKKGLFIDENEVESKSRKGRWKKGKKKHDGKCIYKKGDIVEHKYWGQGRVTKIKKLPDDDYEIDVEFDSAGLKNLLLSFAPIKKVE
ncbi:MAG: UvrD-helicase domain-containing protein [Actinomycetota bacterium]|nr:UvrD-helicase domain-containing protein [Actinomycetota bacterium]